MQPYGIKAYIQQAEYAEKVLDDNKSRAYLLYKTCIYFYRILKKICKSDLPAANKTELIKFSKILYSEKNISEWQIVGLLIQEAMFTKAIKLINHLIISKIKYSVKLNLN